MSYLKKRSSNTPSRGGQAKALGRRVTTSRVGSVRGLRHDSRGFTLIELVITVIVLTILTLGAVPLLKMSVKRQKEQQLRAALRQMRMAIDEFHRDTVGMQCSGLSSSTPDGNNPRSISIDPRSRVMITDCTIFGVDNPDRYPPTLDALVEGVNVRPRAGIGGGLGQQNVNATDVGNPELSTKKKIYLRNVPLNPITGEKDWEFRSNYDDVDADSWGGENVFDVIFPPDKDQYFKPMKESEKYSDW